MIKVAFCADVEYFLDEHGLSHDGDLMLCTKCDNPASWDFTVTAGWFCCAPCCTGEADSFDDGDLIVMENDILVDFITEFKQKQDVPKGALKLRRG